METFTVLTCIVLRDSWWLLVVLLSSSHHLMCRHRHVHTQTKCHGGESSEVLLLWRGLWGQFCASHHPLPLRAARFNWEEKYFLKYHFYFSVLESVGNTFRNDDEGGERNFLTTGDITPLVWTDEEPMKRLNNGNPVEETLHTSSAQQSDSLSKTKIRNRKRIFLNQQLKHLQLELSQLERDVELMKNNDMFYYLEM